MSKAAIFVVILISAILILIAVKTLFISDKDSSTVPLTPIKRAQAIECLNNLRNIRGKITIYSAENSRYPSDLSDLKGVAGSCPTTNQSYQYDGASGKIGCPAHPNY